MKGKALVKKPLLKTNRIALRQLTEDDLYDLYLLHSDEDVMRFLLRGTNSSIDQAKADLNAFLQHQKVHGFGKAAIVNRSTGQFMGRAGFVVVPETGEIEMGYAFHKKYWGKGLATELAKEMYAYALTKWPRSKIISTVMTGNLASVRVLEKIGFYFDGRAKLFGTEIEVFRPHRRS